MMNHALNHAIVAVLLMLPGTIALLVGAVLWIRVREQFGWEAARGIISTSEAHFDGEDYRPRIEYTYTWHGRTFRGTRLWSLGIQTSWARPARKIVAKYRPGAEVTVFVDPTNPSQAVLERGGDPKFLPFILCFSAFLIFFGYSLLHAYRSSSHY